jgi:hypothetical protein
MFCREQRMRPSNPLGASVVPKSQLDWGHEETNLPRERQIHRSLGESYDWAAFGPNIGFPDYEGASFNSSINAIASLIIAFPRS